MSASRRSRASGPVALALILGLALAGASPRPAGARPLSAGEVRTAVQTWVRLVTADARPDAVVESMEPYRESGEGGKSGGAGEVLAYIARLTGGGYCLCGDDDLLLPVYYYAPRGSFSRDEPDQRGLLDHVAAIARQARAKSLTGGPDLLRQADRLAERAAFWQDLLAGRRPLRMEQAKRLEAPTRIVLGLTSLWHQSSPYNDQCPVLTPGSDERTKVGCVATAAAMIMRYWQWPLAGAGSGAQYDYFSHTDDWVQTLLPFDPGLHNDGWATERLRWTADSGGLLQMNGYWDNSIVNHRALDPEYADSASNAVYRQAVVNLYGMLQPDSTYHYANFGGTTYDWSVLEDEHTDPPDTPGDAEVAKLCYHLGVAMTMGWNLYASTNSLGDGMASVVEHFRYDPDAQVLGSDAEGITEEIRWLRPVWMSGDNHSFIAFGYDAATDPDRQFRINNGWGYVGGGDGWFTLDTVWPEGQKFVSRFAPSGPVRFVGTGATGDGSPAQPFAGVEEALAAVSDGTTLIFRAGSDNTFVAAELVIDGELTLKGKDVVLRRGY